MNAQPNRKTRRALGLAVAMATAVSLTGVAQARHTTCTKAGQNYPYTAGNPQDCPEFSPGFSYNIRYPFRDTPAAFQVEVSQARHEALPMLTEIYYPRGWQFTTNIQAAGAADCSSAIGTGDQTNQYLAGRPIEALTNAVGMQVYEGNAGIRRLGRATDPTLTGNAASTERRQGDAMIGFLNWNESYTAPGVRGRVTLCLAMNDGLSKDVVETMYLDALTNDTEFGWRLTIDTARILNPANGYVAADAGIAYFDIDFNDMSLGNWNRFNGVKTRKVWSRANRVPTQTQWKAVMTTCRSGIYGYSLAACPSDHVFRISRTQRFTVSQPPVIPPQPFANITSAGGVTIPGTGDSQAAGGQPVGNPQPVSGFGYSDAKELAGGTTIPVKWTVPAANSGAEVTGFALAVAEITRNYDPTNHDAELAAGRLRFMRFDRADVCTGTACATNIDVSQLTPDNATIDGKYNIGIATIYSLGAYQGYRSDLLCDGVSTGLDLSDKGRGVLCPADRPSWLPGNPQNKLGADRYQVVVRSQSWPQRYVISNPLSLMLMDTSSGNAEYYIWGTTAATGLPAYRRTNWGRDVGPGERFISASNLVVNPTSPTTAAFLWGKLNPDQDGSYSWQIPGEIGVPGRPFYAQLQEYWSGWADLDWIDIPGVNPQNPTQPTTCLSAACGSNEGPPHIVITELSGTAF